MIRNVDAEKDAAEIAEINKWYVENTTAVFDTVALSPLEMKQKVEEITGRFPFYVYEREGKVRGYCYAHPWKEKQAYFPTWETTVYLHPEERGKGIGKEMMRWLIDDCRTHGCHSLIACITAENLESCRFHESLGFGKASCFREVGKKFGRLLDVVDYQLIL